jgi:formate hydrogenlyase transcriptional activator
VVAGATGRFGLLRLIADLGARLATTETSAIDDAIVDSLRQIGQALDLDRIALWRKVEGASFVVTLHHWASFPQPPGSESLNLTCLPFVAARVGRGEVASFRRIEEVADPVGREVLLVHGFRSAAVVPLASTAGGNGVDGVLTFSFTTSEHDWPTATIELLRLATGVIAQALERQAGANVLARALGDLDRLRKQTTSTTNNVERRDGNMVPGPRCSDAMRAEDVYLRREVQERLGTGVIIGQSPSIRRLMEQVQHVAATDSTVLLLGETGTGKELLATRVHELGARRGRAMMRVSCSAIPRPSWKASCSGARRAPSQGRSRGRSGASKWPTAPPFSSTRLATYLRRFRSSCCACWSSGRSNGSGARKAFTWTCGSSRRPIGISSSASPTARFGKTCSTA